VQFTVNDPSVMSANLITMTVELSAEQPEPVRSTFAVLYHEAPQE
jgi:hypothetical protein